MFIGLLMSLELVTFERERGGGRETDRQRDRQTDRDRERSESNLIEWVMHLI